MFPQALSSPTTRTLARKRNAKPLISQSSSAFDQTPRWGRRSTSLPSRLRRGSTFWRLLTRIQRTSGWQSSASCVDKVSRSWTNDISYLCRCNNAYCCMCKINLANYFNGSKLKLDWKSSQHHFFSFRIDVVHESEATASLLLRYSLPSPPLCTSWNIRTITSWPSWNIRISLLSSPVVVNVRWSFPLTPS